MVERSIPEVPGAGVARRRAWPGVVACRSNINHEAERELQPSVPLRPGCLRDLAGIGSYDAAGERVLLVMPDCRSASDLASRSISRRIRALNGPTRNQ